MTALDHFPSAPTDATEARRAPPRRALLLILALVLAFNSVDRIGLGVLLQDIKLDLKLSDTQLGLLTGIAFSAFYSLMGIPIARLADRSNRIMIISVSTALWSIAVASCATVTTFAQFLVARMMVAVGEAGSMPTSLALISDSYSRVERPRAVSFYMQGVSVSLFVGYLSAGWLNQLFGWRVTFVAMALPGVPLVIAALLFLRDPRRTKRTPLRRNGPAKHEASPTAAVNETTPGVIRHLLSSRTFRNLLLFYAVLQFFNVGIVQWQPAFFMRSFGLTSGELGTAIALVCGAGQALGTWLGGHLSTRYAAGREKLQLRGMAVAYCCVGVASACVYLSPNAYAALSFLAIWTVAGTLTSGPLLAMIQSLVPPTMRATAMTLVLLVANLIGMGFGPLAAGILSDALNPWLGTESLRYALLCLSPGYAWGAWHLYRAGSTVSEDIVRTQHAEETPIAVEQSEA